jgi:alpha-beta hydrolase superfamily lysophospholipase
MKGMNQLYKKKNLANISKEEHILVVSGVDDPVGEYSKGVKDLEAMYQKLGVKDVQLILYPNMRHEILNEDDKDQVIQDILDFIS